MPRTIEHLFISGVPASGKSCFGKWLAANKGYLHIDAEIDGGADFDRAGVHDEWNIVVETGRANAFVESLDTVVQPVVINWGFPVRFLYVVSALKAAGMRVWWFGAPHDVARAAFVVRGGINPRLFDVQMADIDRERHLIDCVFGSHRIETLSSSGRVAPGDIWNHLR